MTKRPTAIIKEVLILLIEYQANLNIKNYIGATVLYKAKLAGNQEICDSLLSFMQANYIKVL